MFNSDVKQQFKKLCEKTLILPLQHLYFPNGDEVKSFTKRGITEECFLKVKL